jgi:hypothetical protein
LFFKRQESSELATGDAETTAEVVAATIDAWS